MTNCYIIGICGPTASGKTTICNEIVNLISKILNERIVIINQDDYYLGGDQNTNFDVPESIDFRLLIEHVKQLMNGIAIEIPIYNFKTSKRESNTKKTYPAKIIIIEGILIFSQTEIKNLCNLKIFISAHKELCYNRRLIRDMKDRNKKFEDIVETYRKHILPSTTRYVNPCKYDADIILLNNENNNGTFIGFDIISSYIEKKIKEIYNIK